MSPVAGDPEEIVAVDRPAGPPDLDGLEAGAVRRILMTVSCRDTDVIPRVDGAGDIRIQNGQAVQVMHNGLLIEEGCYDGRWMTEIIRGLAGHHEPQEELVFDTVIRRLADLHLDQPTIIEFGSYWAYYSLWFVRDLPGARAIAMEPDPDHLEVGRRNAALNGLEDRVEFLHGAVGSQPGELVTFRTEGTKEELSVVQHDLASLMGRFGLDRIDVALVDIQGAETVLLERARPLLEAGKVRFIFVSTHHQSISGDPRTHQRALELLRDCGAHVIAEHTVRESFSGDGLIAATFDPAQRDLTVSISRARARDSLFGEPENELDALTRQLSATTRRLEATRAEVDRIHGSKTWRWSSVPRRLYGRVRRASSHR
jgi:FkbM family methyltransferase